MSVFARYPAPVASDGTSEENSENLYRPDLTLALRLADAADDLTMQRFGAADLKVDTKPDLTPVSDADRAVEELLRSQVAQTFPEDAVLGEEFGTSGTSGTSERQWIIDPIDGTKNYVRGVPVWATLIALTIHDAVSNELRVAVGVVSAPAIGRRWWAARGTGAWLRDLTTDPAGRRIGVSGVSDLKDASVSYSDWDDPAWDLDGRRERFDAMLRNTWRSRAFGDFWSHMMVAEGSVDVAVEPQLSTWDMAALIPIVEEAGGTVTALDGQSPLVGGNALTTNGLLHPQLLEALSSR
jgi:histidinol-phosphatase